MKKIAFLLMLLLALDVGTAMADTCGDYEYWAWDGKATVTGYTGHATELTIPAELDGNKVTSIGDYAFKGCKILDQRDYSRWCYLYWW